MLNNSKAVNKIETNFCCPNQENVCQTKRTAVQLQVVVPWIVHTLNVWVCVSLGLFLTLFWTVCMCVHNVFEPIHSRDTNGLNKKELAHRADNAWWVLHSCSCSCLCSYDYDCSYHLRINMRTVSHSIIFHKCTVNCYKYPNASHFTGDKMMRCIGGEDGTRGDTMHRKSRETKETNEQE